MPFRIVFYSIFCISALSRRSPILEAASPLRTALLNSWGGGRGRGKPLPRALGNGESEDRTKTNHLGHRRPEGWWDSKRFARPHQPLGARWPRIQQKQQEQEQELRQEQPRGQEQGQGVGPGQQRDRSLGVYLRRSALPSCDDRNLPGRRPPMRQSVKRCGAYMLSKL